MLQRLVIKNYAIIDEVDISLSRNLSIITGETGAGKSILMGALSLILGERADSNVLYEKDQKCITEGFFDITNYNLKSFFKQHELDEENPSIIRREINPAGKSRAFINDTPVTLQVLKQLTTRLVDMHTQHETLELGESGFQIIAIDALAGNEEKVKQYRKDYNLYKEHLSHLNRLKEGNRKAYSDKDYYQFQLEELLEANIQPGEQEMLEQELEKLNNTEDIKQNLTNAVGGLDQEEHSVNNQLREIRLAIHQIKDYHKDLGELYERLESTRIELEDISRELENIKQSTVYDTTRVEEINDRLDMLYKLQKKHHVTDDHELLKVQEEFDNKLQSVSLLSEEQQKLEEKVKEEHQALFKQAQEISANRKKAAPGFCKKVNALLSEVGMEHAELKVEITPADDKELNSNGIDRVYFLFAPNKGGHFLPLKKVASGGELSRLMLCIKSLIASSTALPTLIFDEIDTGVSGEVSMKVGRILEQLSSNHQVICITHLPQIAAKGDQHYYVYKESSKERTFTRLKALKQDERIMEIAKMLSGAKPGEAAVENAKDLINLKVN